jgi:hypothetical protein
MAEKKKGRDLPAAPEEYALARTVNLILPPHVRVTPYRFDLGEDEIGYGLVYEYFSARYVNERNYPFFDPDEIIQDVQAWMQSLAHQRANGWEIAR